MAAQRFEQEGFDSSEKLALDDFVSLLRTYSIYSMTDQEDRVSYYPPHIPKNVLITQTVLIENIPSENIGAHDIYVIPSQENADLQV